MSAAADTFADPLVARQATVPLAYHDDRELWPILDAGFSRVSTLPRTEWSPPTSATTYVIPELHCAPMHHTHATFDFPNLPINWYRLPYVHLLLVNIEPADASNSVDVIVDNRPVKVTSAEITKQRVKVWCEDMCARGHEWLVVYMPVPSGKSSRSLFDTFRMLTGSQQYGGSSLGVSFYGATFAALRQECGVNRKHWSRFIRLDHYELQRREAARRAARRAAAATAGGGAAVPPAVGAHDAAAATDGSAGEAGEGSSSSAAASPRKPPLMRAFTSRFGAGGGGSGGAAAAAAGAGGAVKDDGAAAAAALPPLDAESAAEIDKQWEELRGRLHAACYDALSARVRLHETELRRLYEQRYVVGWNYAPYFCLTESLAFVFAQIRLPQEALRCYDEVAQVFDLCSSVPERLTAQLSFAERLAEVCGASLAGFASGSGAGSAAAAAHSGGASTPVSPGRGGSLYGGFGGSGGSYGRRTGAAGGSATATISGISRSTALVIFGASPSLQEMLQALRTVSGLSDRPMLAPYPPALLQSLQQQEGSRPGVLARSPSGYMPAAGLAGAAGSRLPATGAAAAGSAGLLLGGVAGAAVSLQPHLFDLTQQPYRQLIYTSQASLFDFRHYLFARQCQLLQMLRREHEIAARAVPFIKVCALGHCGKWSAKAPAPPRLPRHAVVIFISIPVHAHPGPMLTCPLLVCLASALLVASADGELDG